MISKICDICGNVEKLADIGSFKTLTCDYGVFIKHTEKVDICPECMKLIKELRVKQKEGTE